MLMNIFGPMIDAFLADFRSIVTPTQVADADGSHLDWNHHPSLKVMPRDAMVVILGLCSILPVNQFTSKNLFAAYGGKNLCR